jgi:hypothetical protein
MGRPTRTLRFVWWNVQDFGHFAPDRAGKKRWPGSTEEYGEKRRRVELVLQRLSRDGPPQILAFAEITDTALREIRDHLFPGYGVHVLGSLYTKPDFRLGIIYDPSTGFEGEDFLEVTNVPETARPMAILDHRSSGNRIRFYACHWTARTGNGGDKWRTLSAQALGMSAYGFLHPQETAEARHVVILGDLNEEPFGLLEEWLYAFRDRTRATTPEHHTDQPIRRLRLYNCTWRMMGEQYANPCPTEGRDVGGSHYWRDENRWHSYDQVIVSGTLLGGIPPFLDERELRVACGRNDLPDELLGADGLPQKFEWDNGNPRGLSDHLPICGRIVLA